jgi:hypothetical protein
LARACLIKSQENKTRWGFFPTFLHTQPFTHFFNKMSRRKKIKISLDFLLKL